MMNNYQARVLKRIENELKTINKELGEPRINNAINEIEGILEIHYKQEAVSK